MGKFNFFPENEDNIPHKRGTFKKSGASKRFGSGVTIFFAKSKPYTCVYEIINIEKYMLAVRTERLLQIGEDDVLGYEMNGKPVFFESYYKYKNKWKTKH